MAREFRLPDLGEGITEAQVIQVLVKKGENVAEDQGLFEVETDKAAVEIPSPYEGPVTEVHVKVGQTVNVGDVMISFEGENKAAPAKTEKKKASAPAAAKVEAAAPVAAHAGGSGSGATARKTTAPAAPAVRKLAREMGVDIDSIPGSGPGGRVTKDDVHAAANGSARGPASAPHYAPAAPAQPAPSAAPPPVPLTAAAPPPGEPGSDKWGSVRVAPMTQIRKTIAKQMTLSYSTAVHVTHIDTVDVTELERMRKQYSLAYGGQRRITAMAFIIKAVSNALRNHPIFNAAIDVEAGSITYKEYHNIGIAVDTQRGLVVPNIRGAENLGVGAIGGSLSKIAENARSGNFAIDDLRGGTFTITNVGALGGTFSTPIINYPEVAILGLGQAKETPVVRDGEIVIRRVMPISMSFDHRAADGAQSARFCKELFGYLENPITLVV